MWTGLLFLPSVFWDNYLKFNDYKRGAFQSFHSSASLNCSNLSVTSNRPTLPISGSSVNCQTPEFANWDLCRNQTEEKATVSGGMESGMIVFSSQKRERSFILQRKQKENKTVMEIPYTELAEIQQGIKKYPKCFLVQFQPGSQIIEAPFSSWFPLSSMDLWPRNKASKMAQALVCWFPSWRS